MQKLLDHEMYVTFLELYQTVLIVRLKTKTYSLQVVRWFFFVILRFRPTLRLTRLKMIEIILTGHKTQI